MQLFYFPDLTAEMTTFTFDKEESSHIVKVLRKKKATYCISPMVKENVGKQK